MGIYDINGNNLTASTYTGKKISILGDSISTFAGWIPSSNANYYTGSNCGVKTVEDTWWKKTINALGMQLEINNSWSGSRVTTTRSTDEAGCMTRCTSLGSPDVIIVYMGINDFNNEVGLGTYDGNGTFPTATTTFREAYAIMLNKMMIAYPQAEIWVCTLPSCERNGTVDQAPEINANNVLLDDFNKAIRNMAQVFNAKIIELAQCGLTYQNMKIYAGDWNEYHTGLHPNPSGHSLIANHVIRQLDASVRTRY